MRIFNFGLEIEAKKYTYQSKYFKQLVDKFLPKKKNPYTAEVIDTELEAADAFVVAKKKIVDFVLIDLEKVEQRLKKAENQGEKQALGKAQNYLESEKILSNCNLEPEEIEFLKNLQLASLKPTVVKDEFSGSVEQVNQLIEEVLEASGKILFFTASEKEAKAWDLNKGKTVLEAAGKIHSDLMRGFIRAEVVNSKHLDDFFNMAEAKSKGLVKTVGKDYIVEAGDIVQIKFSV